MTREDSPPFLLPRSHTLGATVFPHDLIVSPTAPDTITYRDTRGHAVELQHRILTGPAGSAALWHSCLPHGTQPVAESRPRISIRYTIEKDPAVSTFLDEVNDTLNGPLALESTRVDQDRAARTIMRGNVINTVLPAQ